MLSIDHTVAGQPEIEAIPQRIFLRNLHEEMVLDYTEKMRKICRSDTNSRHISVCKEYIYSHLKERITIEDLADELGVSASYLSRLFRKETGRSEEHTSELQSQR